MLPIVRHRGSVAPACVSVECEVDIPGGRAVGYGDDRAVFLTYIGPWVAVVSDARPRRDQAGVLVRVSLQCCRILKVEQWHPHDVDRQFVSGKLTNYVLLNDRGSVPARRACRVAYQKHPDLAYVGVKLILERLQLLVGFRKWLFLTLSCDRHCPRE